MLHVVHCHVGGHEGRLAVFLLVLLLCQQPGLGVLRGNDVLNFSTKGRKEPGRALGRRTSGPRTEVSGEAGGPPLSEDGILLRALHSSAQLTTPHSRAPGELSQPSG